MTVCIKHYSNVNNLNFLNAFINESKNFLTQPRKKKQVIFVLPLISEKTIFFVLC